MSSRGPISQGEGAAATTHRRVQTNGITMHIAEAGAGPVVILLHGFPELWYSWRHQLPVLAAAGYHVIAPDLRGCGETDAPDDVASYSKRNMTADIVGLLDALGADRATIVGHDWGASLAWALAELHPERVATLVSLSVPYHPREQLPPTRQIQRFAGDHFSFPLYFQQPGIAEAELDANPRRSLRLFLHALSGDAPPDLVPYLFTGKPAEAGALDGMPEPTTLPAWLTEADLDYFAQAYARTGFRGALAPYRNMDHDWADLPAIGTAGVSQPTLFLGGRRDSAVIYGRFEPMEAAVPKLRRIVLLPGCGHWTQQERPADVNAELLDFLQRER
ncbi:MAG TPA: alpha/beta hydrolase [Chloroflexota bacterium]|nr:alpha/beta hydrolase [Chloroflexota bacterium]